MSFLKDIGKSGLFGLGGMAAAGGGGLKDLASSGLFGLGGMALSGGFGHDTPGPSKLDKIGGALNMVAQAGGAAPGYQAHPAAAPVNHFQMMDDDYVRNLIQNMGADQFGIGLARNR